MDILNLAKSSLKVGADDIITFPTEAHRAFINYITQQCRERAITALLKGSLAKGTAKEHSDIDIILMGDISQHFDDMVGSFDKILLSEHFPSSLTYMVIYASGLAVEYDIRKSVTEEDLRKSRVLNYSNGMISNIRRDRFTVDSKLCPVRSPDYSKLIIAQMCCAKLLCQKNSLARDIYCDRLKLLSADKTATGSLDWSEIHAEPNAYFINRIKQLAASSNAYSSEEIRKYINALFSCVEHCNGENAF